MNPATHEGPEHDGFSTPDSEVESSIFHDTVDNGDLDGHLDPASGTGSVFSMELDWPEAAATDISGVAPADTSTTSAATGSEWTPGPVDVSASPDEDVSGANPEIQFGQGGYTGGYDGIANCWYSNDGYIYAPNGTRIGAQ